MSAVLAAVFNDHAAAEAVRTRLVSDGFPTDRVELTSRREPGQAGTGPAESLPDQLEDYFRQLFDRDEEQRFVASLAANVRDGHAAVVVHPRGEIETNRAVEILEGASPLELHDRDLDQQTMEQAAAPDETPVVKKVLMGERH
jgi:hypothetical protein